MLADVIERFDAVVVLSHHQDFFPPDGLHLPVPWLRQFRLAPQQEPNPRPHAFPFLLHKFATGVAGSRDAMSADDLLRPDIQSGDRRIH